MILKRSDIENVQFFGEISVYAPDSGREALYANARCANRERTEAGKFGETMWEEVIPHVVPIDSDE